jgi:hypothetical protein
MRLAVLSAAFVLWAELGMGQEAVWAEQPSPPPAVLILNQSNSYRPWPNQIINEIRTTLDNRAGGSVAVYAEDLDLYRFNGPGYLDITEKYLEEKYRNKPLGAIMPLGSAGLDYALRIRNSLWPDVPIVFAAVDRKTTDLETVPGVTGITIQLNLADMIRAASALLPDTKHFVLVGDRFEKQLYYSQFAEELAEYSRTFDFIDLMGLPLSVVKQRLATLPEQSAILYIGINSDQTMVYVLISAPAPWADTFCRPSRSAMRPGNLLSGSSREQIRRPFLLRQARVSGRFSIGASSSDGTSAKAIFLAAATCAFGRLAPGSCTGGKSWSRLVSCCCRAQCWEDLSSNASAATPLRRSRVGESCKLSTSTAPRPQARSRRRLPTSLTSHWALF